MIKQDDQQDRSSLLTWREKLLALRVLIPSWEEVKSNPALQTRAKKLGLFLLVLIVFNIGLYIFLGPTWFEPTYEGYYTDEFVNFNEKDWFEIDGDWKVSNGMLVQNSYVDINPAIMLSLHALPEDTVEFSADLSIGDGGDAGGIRFNMWSPEQIARSHQVMIMRIGDQAFLTGGYYANSVDFVPQFKLPLAGPFEENSSGSIKVVADQESYDVYLNKKLVVLDVPTIYPPGWHGLSAIGNTVAFDSIEIDIDGADRETSRGLADRLFGNDDAESFVEKMAQIPNEGLDLIIPADGDPESIGWIPFNGIWTERNGSLIQSMWQQVDARAAYEVPYPSYRLEVDLWHPQTPGGGGVIFGMPSTDSLSNAYLMRFSDGGEGFFIGQYDSNGQFEGMAFEPLPAVGQEVQTLSVINDGTTFEVTLNDKPIFGQLPHSGADSHFGLVSNQTEVVFDRIFIEPFDAPKRVELQPVGTESEQESEDSPSESSDSAAVADSTVAETNASTDDTQASTIPISPELENITQEPVFQSTFLGTLGETKWVPFRGDWSIEEGALIQSNKNGFDFAIGYNEPYENFVLRSTFSHTDGQGGGVLFGMTRPDSRNLAHVVRYDSGQNAILYGYFDENSQFSAQGGEAVAPPLNNLHQLDIVKNSDTYDIYVDGLKLIGDIPLIAKGAYIGLTTSTSVVRFETVELFPLGSSDGQPAAAEAPPATATPTVEPPATPTAEPVEPEPVQAEESAEAESPTATPQPSEEAETVETTDEETSESTEPESEPAAAESGSFDQAVPISGSWIPENGEISQVANDMVDQVLSLNQFGTEYSFEVDLTMVDDPETENVGAGVVFNTPTADSKNEGQIVRFLNGGSEIIWGYFDENGRFNGQGGSGVGLEPGSRQTLTLVVRATTFDIIVNDNTVAADLSLRSTEGGYVNLITFRGPVTFHETRFSETEPTDS